MIKGKQYHPIIASIFEDVKNIHDAEQIQVNCPRCQERDGLLNPDEKFNLEINTNKRVFRCWKCDSPRFSGSLGKLIKLFGTNIDFDLYESLGGNMYDFDNEYVEECETIQVQLPKEIVYFSNMDITNSEHLEAYCFLVGDRKIDREIILEYKIGFCYEGRYRGRIIIPSYDNDGMLNYFVARTYKGQKPPYTNPEADKQNIIFNEGKINWDSTIYLVEGIFDMLSTPNAIPILGKILSDRLFFLFKEKKPNIVILLDPDAIISSITILQKLKTIYFDEEYKIKIVMLTGKDDIDEIRKKDGIDKLRKTIYGARELNINDYFILNESFYNDRKNRRYRISKKHY